MKAERVDEYHNHGCDFVGKLVMVDYLPDAQGDSRWGQFGAGVSLDYAQKAAKLVQEKYGEPIEVLLTIPEYVCRIN